jgi:single-strand DNA-binding protein
MKHVNLIVLLGNVGADPKKGNGVARFRLATNRTWKGTNGEKQERTTWTTCVAFGKLADIVAAYVVKGSTVHVKGYTESREYEKEGAKREAYEVIIEDLVLISKPQDDSSTGTQNRSSSQTGYSRQSPPQNNARSSGQGHSSSPPASQHGGEFGDDGFEDYPV